jgi:hypothetical protein
VPLASVVRLALPTPCPQSGGALGGMIRMQEEHTVVGRERIALPTIRAAAVNSDPAKSKLNG